jgi:MFS family permease
MPSLIRPRLSPIWRNRDFRRYWTAEAVSSLGTGLTDFALPIVAVVTLHVTPAQMGLIRGLTSIPTVFVGLLAGVWVDRVSRQRLLIGLDLAAAALVASVPVAYVLDALSVQHLYALALTFGTLAPFWWAAWNAFLPSVVAPDQIVEANSKITLLFSTNGITGPGLGGILLGFLRAPFVLFIDALSFVAASLFLVGVRPRVPERLEEVVTSRVRTQIADGLRTTFVDPIQRAITIPRAILDVMDAISTTVIVLYIIREVDLTPQLMGLAFALSSVGFVAGSLIAPRLERRLNVGRMIVLGLFLVAVSPYTMVIANDSLPDAVNVLFFAIPGFIGGTGGIIQYIGLTALRQSVTPEPLLGRVFASANTLGAVLTVIGAFVGGVLGEAVGLRAAIVVAAIGYAFPFFYSLVSPLRRATLISEKAEEKRGGKPQASDTRETPATT